MKVKLCCGGHILNVVSAYSPQGGCDEVKNRFWREMDEMITSTEMEERLVIGGDLNGHTVLSRENIRRIHGGHGMGEMNEEGELVVDFALSFDLAVNSAFFTSKNYAAYSSGGRQTQIDFLLCRRNHLVKVKNGKIIKGETVIPQHRLVVSDFLIWQVAEGKPMVQPKIKWWMLKDQEMRQSFKEKVLHSIRVADDVNIWWVENCTMILRTAEKLLGKTSGRVMIRIAGG
ncbi:craniofacial development protein 2-like [Macrobrachium rosenbergii]|uniref:craniofacial development protein 2-like n=1 Tax=Macrobrachium rosenbergii TaxID=79674 RepID=UPI0034D652D1